MEKMIEIQYEGKGGMPHLTDALVEYIRYDDDGKIMNEITNVFLSEEVPSWQIQYCKTQAIEIFHRNF